MPHHLVKRLWQSFLQLNLYKKSSSDASTAPKEQIATRLYICSLALAIIIIIIVTASIPRTINKIEYSPQQTRFSYIAKKYSNTIFCPCSTIGISYDTFVTINARFHQVCSSQFVQQAWIDAVFIQLNNTSYSLNDFRLTLSSFWQVIAGLCRISKTTWSDLVAGFNTSYPFNPVAVTEQVIRLQTEAALSNAIYLARTKLVRDLLAIRRIMSGNQVVSALATNFYPRYPPGNSTSATSLKMSPRIYDNCSCLRIQGCPHSATINGTNGQLITIPGMIADCYVMDAALASTLECYYHQSCLNLLHPSLLTPIQTLSNTSNKHFTINSTVDVLLNRIMIDEIISDVRFNTFYSQCSPTYCSYSYTRQFDVLFVATTIIGIFGGISFVLRIIASLLAKIIIRWINRRMPRNIVSNVVASQQRKLNLIITHIRLLLNRIQRIIVDLNIFDSEVPRAESIISREKLLTRLFLLLLIVFSIAAGFYTFLTVQNTLIIIKHPSLAIYERLYNDYADTLHCPCSHQSISYGNFLNVTFDLHQVCSSDLVSPTWLNYLESFDPILLPPWAFYEGMRDFRTTGNSYFQLLATFCSLVKRNIEDAQSSFFSIQLINDRVISSSRFTQETNAIITSYIKSTQDDFQRIFAWIMFTFTSSYFLTGANTNSDIVAYNNDTIIIKQLNSGIISKINYTDISIISACSCPVEFYTCIAVNLLYTNGTSLFDYERIFWEIPIACMPLTGFLISTCTWWYNQNYLNDVERTYSGIILSQASPKLNALDALLPTQYKNESLQHLFDQMLIEPPIRHEASFSLYYNQCAPSSCSYTVVKHRDLLVALLLLISICGGLNRILRILVTVFGKFIYFLIDWRQNRESDHASSSVFAHFKHLCVFIYKAVINMNLYKTTATNEIDLRQQRLYTRVYVILFTGSLIVLLFYTAIIERNITKTHTISSVEDYENLRNIYQNNINCPCTHISIPYNKFVTELQVNRTHQACSTNLVHMALKAGTRNNPGTTYPNNKNFRNFVDVFYQGLQQLCLLSEQNVDRSVALFNASSVLVKEVMTRSQFYAEINVILNRFQQKVPIEFARGLNLLRTNIQGNALMAVFSTNWQLVVARSHQERNASFRSVPVTYSDMQENRSCSCATLQTCTMPAQIFNESNEVTYTFEGLRLGCYSLETILASSLSCFYSVTCINNFRQMLAIPKNRLLSYQTLTNGIIEFNSTTTRFNINDTIETIANEMFIESWTRDVSYERFFNSCAPIYCTYKEYYRFDALILLTAFLSVYVGLSLGARILAPILVKIVKKILNRFRIVPVQ